MRIAITTSSFAQFDREPLALIERAGFSFVLNPHGRKLTREETISLCADCQGIVAGTETYDAEVLDRLPELKVLSRCGVGMDSVDQEACAARGIAVCNTPLGPTRAVAELVAGLILDMLRNISLMDRELRGGTWKKRMGSLLEGKRVGIVGYGRIGRATGDLLEHMGASVAFSDPFVREADRERMELPDLLAWADIISLHCSKTAKACHLLDGVMLSLMRPGSWLVNAGRGGLVDEEALAGLLRSGHLAGAAIDCFEKEPYAGPLREIESAILTPHIGSYAREGRIRMETDAVRNLLDSLGVSA